MSAFAIVLLLVFATLIYFFTVRVREGRKPALRHIEAFEAIKGAMGQSIESGQALHISLGIGGLADQTTADSLAGLAVLRYVGNQAATTGVSPTVSMADPMVLLMAQQAMQAAFGKDRAGAADTYQNIYWTAPQPAAYAAGVLNILNVDEVKTNVMVGNFGDEYLLMGETAVRNNTMHVGGASDPNVLPFVFASADEALLGEEMFAAGAYLEQRPSHVGSLMAQDTMRWIIGLFIVGGILWASIQ